MLATLTLRRHIVGTPTPRRKFGVVGAIAFFVSSIVYFLLYEVFHILETFAGFYLLVVAGTLFACFTAYHQSGVLLSWAQSLGAVSGVVLMYWNFRTYGYFGGVPLKPPYFVYRLNAVEFWIPAGIILGTLAFGIGVSLRWVTDR